MLCPYEADENYFQFADVNFKMCSSAISLRPSYPTLPPTSLAASPPSQTTGKERTPRIRT